jgi:hypothetical protein
MLQEGKITSEDTAPRRRVAASFNQTLETNCRTASPLDAGRQLERAVHARPYVSGGSRSAIRWALVGGLS